MNTLEDVLRDFGGHFGKAEIIIKSPGRANIIGEHIDYHGGCVLPFAIDQAIYFALSISENDEVIILSKDTEEKISFDTISSINITGPTWLRYILQVLDLLPIKRGFKLCFGGNLPIGAGLSSSSALTLGLVAGLNELFRLELNKEEMVHLASRAENGTGLAGGMMDQYAIIMGKEGKGVFLDCHTHMFDWVDLKLQDYEFVLFDSGKRHELINTPYNERRKLSEGGLNKLKNIKGVEQLSDLSIDDLEMHKEKLTSREENMIRYVIQENNRVSKAREFISSDISKVGSLLFQSHFGLSNLYRVSCHELDLLVNLAKNHPDILGARMMGGGFGGCTINLVRKNADLAHMRNAYLREVGEMKTYKLWPSQGLVRLLN